MDGEDGVRDGPDAVEGAAEDPRVAELLRANAELAAEIRRLALGLAGAPRSTQTTTSRRLAALVDERDTLLERIEALEHDLELNRAHRGELERANFELGQELNRLRSGPRGLVRRAFAHLLRR